jgi:hypothetical protein
MRFKYVIYISAFFVVAYLILKNPSGYQTAANKFTAWFAKTFSAFGRVS